MSECIGHNKLVDFDLQYVQYFGVSTPKISIHIVIIIRFSYVLAFQVLYGNITKEIAVSKCKRLKLIIYKFQNVNSRVLKAKILFENIRKIYHPRECRTNAADMCLPCFFRSFPRSTKYHKNNTRHHVAGDEHTQLVKNT